MKDKELQNENIRGNPEENVTKRVWGRPEINNLTIENTLNGTGVGGDGNDYSVIS